MCSLLESEIVKLKIVIILMAIATMLGWQAEAQIYDTNNVVVQTFAGSGFSGYVDGIVELTMFNNPSAVVADSSGNLFVWDYQNYRIRKITPDGTVSTFAGGGSQTTGYGTNASLNYTVNSMAIDHENALWLVVYYYNYLLRIGSDAHVSITPLNGLSFPFGVCVDSGNKVYIFD